MYPVEMSLVGLQVTLIIPANLLTGAKHPQTKQ